MNLYEKKLFKPQVKDLADEPASTEKLSSSGLKLSNVGDWGGFANLLHPTLRAHLLSKVCDKTV